MAEGDYHQNIRKCLLSLAKSKGYIMSSPKYAKLPISHPTQQKLWFDYIPDFWINSTRPGEMFIFEIFYDELNDPDKIIADLLQCYIVHILTNIKKVIIFIVPNKKGEENVTLYCTVVRNCLIKKGILAKKQIPNTLNSRWRHILIQ